VILAPLWLLARPIGDQAVEGLVDIRYSEAIISTKAKSMRFLVLPMVGGPIALLVITFVLLVEPAAAREVKAACDGLRPNPRGRTFTTFPSPAPDFRAKDKAGNMISLSAFRGKVVLVNFWASWCNVCKSEKPKLEALQKELGTEDFVTLALASDTDWDDIQLPGTPLTVLLDPPTSNNTIGPIAKSYGITAVPESFVVDKTGQVQFYFVNRRDWDSGIAKTCLRALIDQ